MLRTGGIDCLYASREVVLAVLKEVLIAKPDKVTIGDAPIQSCNFSALVSDDFRLKVQSLAHKTGVEIEVIEIPTHIDVPETVEFLCQSRGAGHASLRSVRSGAG